MLSRSDFIKYSLEINLFFLRLAKEHTIFAAAALMPRDKAIRKQLITLKNQQEMLLGHAVSLSQGVLSPEILASGELVTDLSLSAEEKTQSLTGIPIDMNITRQELQLKPGGPAFEENILFQQVVMLNQQSIHSLNNAIKFTEDLAAEISKCNAASHIYPSMLHHIIVETRFFTGILIKLQKREDMESINQALVEELKLNWNEIMKEHAQFVRGQLDPSEVKLFDTSNAFVKRFNMLSKEDSREILSPEFVKESMSTTTNLRNFNRYETEGLLACKIRAITLPLLADHMTREANHYLRILKTLVRYSELHRQ